MRALLLLVLAPFFFSPARLVVYDVGPGQPYTSIGAVPWATLQPGDTVRIHWRATPYAEKWVICRTGPITVTGVPNGSQLPVITGDGAVTPAPLNYWNENRGVIKIGGANTPPDLTPTDITIENLEIRSARPAFGFTDDGGSPQNYISNASAIYVEKGTNITIRNCILHDCGNGFFSASQSTNLLLEGNYIYDNGISGSIFEHNNYTESNGITFQYNRFGPLRAGCPGNNLKDRSAGTVIRYNWIESGNRQLDLVDSSTLNGLGSYNTTHVYGNTLIEPDGAGNSQIVHYGGDSGTTANYRQGTMHFYNNTVVSTRSGNTTLFRLSTNSESCEARNNIFYVTAGGSNLALLNQDGTLNHRNNWFKPGWVDSHGALGGTINDAGGHTTGASPGFENEGAQDFRLATGSPCIDQGTGQAAGALALLLQYIKHRQSEARPSDGSVDLGAYEFGASAGGTTGGGGGGGGGGGCGATGMEFAIPMLLIFLFRNRSRRAGR